MRQTFLLVFGAIVIFAIVAAVMVQLMPKPLGDSDYLVIGSVATLVALLVLFLVLITTRMKSSETFFKKRPRNEKNKKLE
jgi:hypothetical protein